MALSFETQIYDKLDRIERKLDRMDTEIAAVKAKSDLILGARGDHVVRQTENYLRRESEKASAPADDIRSVTARADALEKALAEKAETRADVETIGHREAIPAPINAQGLAERLHVAFSVSRRGGIPDPFADLPARERSAWVSTANRAMELLSDPAGSKDPGQASCGEHRRRRESYPLYGRD